MYLAVVLIAVNILTKRGNMSIFNFAKNYGKVKSEDFEEGMVNLAARLDADGVAETAIKQKQDEHDLAISQLAEANSAYKKEKAEFEAEQSLYNKRMAAAELAQVDLEKLALARELLAKDPTDQAAAKVVAGLDEKEITAALTDLLTAIEKRAPILEREKREAEQAEEWMNTMQSAAQDIATELLQLRESVTQAKADIAQAEVEKERQRKKAEQADILAGLKKSGNKFDTAMNALKNRAAEVNKESEEYRLKAEQLTIKPELSSETIDKYMNQAPATSTETLQERLARLKAKV